MVALAETVCKQVLTNAGALTTSPQSFGILGTGWLPLTALALASSLLILVLMNIFASFLRNQQLAAWCKFELFQIFGTAVIALLVITAIVEGMCGFDMSFLDSSAGSHYKNCAPNQLMKGSPTHCNMYEIADRYLGELENVGELLFYYLMWVVKWINFLSKITWESRPLGFGSSDSPLDSLSQVNSLFFYMIGGFVTSFVLLQLQVRILDYMSIAVLYYLFPFGIFFRAFEPTRGFGGTLIGLSLAFFLFYPIIIVFNDYMMHGSISDTRNSASVMSELGFAVDDANAKAKEGKTGTNQTAVAGQDPSLLPKDAISNDITGSIMFLLKPVALYFIAAVVLPIINFIVLVEITRGLTELFGEEVDVSNLTRLI